MVAIYEIFIGFTAHIPYIQLSPSVFTYRYQLVRQKNISFTVYNRNKTDLKA